ncbi:MAG: DUF1330 domain-containing protein [Pseudomonadales bacterium]|nr:DUF1330 domain-containing protein [Pseudomonadales bacterium]
MKAYVIVDITIENSEDFMEYVGQIPALIAKHGGRYLVRGAEPETVLAQSESPQYLAVLEFPSRESANAFLEERNSVGLADLFARTTKSRILLADGVEDDD